MSKELVIGSNRHETKVAVLEDDQLVELYFQRANEYSLAGSIHKGRVTRVLPGMQSAFVDLGLERDTFLYVSDFFEEHGEDIDTVSDEKPVRVRAAEDGSPDRGRDDRGQRRERGGRPAYERPPVTVAAAPEPEHYVAPPALIGDLEDDLDEPEEVPAPVTMAGEVRAADGQPRAANNDRSRGTDDRGGDRRGRRSRRRRGRGGRAIPDNKYAQPAAGESGPSAEPPEYRSDGHLERHLERAPEVEERMFAPGVTDVIILPGESLAKYRGRPESAPQPVAAAPVAETLEDEVEYEEQDENQQEIAEEADSLELADKVFSHRDQEPFELSEEEKIEDVRLDHAAPEGTPAPPAEAAAVLIVEMSAAAEHADDVSDIHELRQEHLADLSWSPERRAAEELFQKVVPIREDEPELVAEHLHHSGPLSQEEAFEAEVEELDATGSISSVHDLAPEIEEALESGDFEANPPEITDSAPTVQSASLRDQGGRFPHRSSRRMRRRRGGNNRGGNEGPSNVPAPAGAAVAGSAPALETVEPRAESFEERVTERPDRTERMDRPERTERADRGDRVMPSISDLLKAGQEIIVQIAKEPLGQKGARITSHIALPGRYVVFMPSVNHLGVSRKVASDEERQRLKRILQAHRVGTTGGFIVRTAGEGVPEEEIAADMNFLYTLWLDIRQKAEKKPAPVLLHYDLDVVQRILRDQITEDFKAIWVDNEDLYESVLTFMQRFQPALVNRVKMYTRSAPIFDAFNITQELEKALRPKVWLKSGGYLVINQTEALVAIDINTGKYVGRSNRLEDTIVKTNTEAVKEIVRQIRLRDLGGIIVVDFIDMDERKNRQKVMQALEEAMRSDKAPYKILQFNDFGLVAITRKRVKQSLERTLCAPCHYCEGAGYIKSTQTVIGEILVEAQKIAKAIEGKDAMLRVHPEVAKVLKGSDNKYLEELEEILGRPVLVKGDSALHSEKFDLG
jgi:ribonuclease G